MDQKQTKQKQTGRMVTGIIAAVLFFINAIIFLSSGFSVAVLIFFAMTAAMVLFALGKRLPAAIITFISAAMWIINIIQIVNLRSHYGYMYQGYEVTLFSIIALLIGYALVGVAMLLPKAKFAALVLPAAALVFDIIQISGDKYYIEEPIYILGRLFTVAIYILASLSCILAKPEDKKVVAAPNRQMPMAGQVATGGTSTMDGIQQPNTQPVAYDQYTGRPIYGYDQYTGRPIYGYDQYGRTIYGFDQNGYPIIGFDPNGYPIYGYDQYGQPIYDPTAPVGASETWNETARKNAEEDLEKIKLKRYKSGLLRLIILNIFTLGIYKLYWIFKTTKFINQYDTLSAKRDPGMNVILCACVPFYAAYWMFKTITSLESMADEGVGTTSAAQMVAIFDIVAPLATWMYAQDRINMLIDGQLERQLVDFTKCKGSPVWAFLLSFFTGGLLGFFWTLKVAKAIEETAEFTLSPFMWALLGVIFPPANMFFALKVGKVLDSRSTRKCAHIAIASAMVPSLHMAILQERINLD